MANGYVTLDLEKPTPTLVDLRQNFQGRVGDSRAYCKLWFRSNGRPFDLTRDHRSVGFSGVDPDGQKWNAVGWMDTDQPGDNAQIGRVTFYFPAGMFRVEGDWDTDSTFFYVDDDKTDMHVSTINVWLHILANQVEMGIDATPFKTDMDKTVAEVKAYGEQKRAEIDQALQQANSDALLNRIHAVNSTVQMYINLINQKQVPTYSDMQNYVNGLFGAEETSHDLNELKQAQHTYLVDAGTTNAPDDQIGVLRVIGDGSDNVGQLFLDSDSNLYVRHYGTNGWTDWRQQTAWN